MKQKIIELFGERFLRRSCIRNDYESLLEIIKGKDIETLLEIGTYRGVSAAILSEYCKKLVTIDLYYGQLEMGGAKARRKGFWRKLGIENIRFYRAKNELTKREFIKNLDFDFAFVDGDHGEIIRSDFEMVKKCGRVLFHDYLDDEDRNTTPIYDLVNLLPENEVTICGNFAYWEKK